MRCCQTVLPGIGFIQLRLQCKDLLRLRLQVMFALHSLPRTPADRP